MNFRSYFPILEWVQNYQKQWLKNDIMAGITVGVMLIPQGIAYAVIAGLPPIYGLYTALIPQVVYAVFGTSRQLAVGPAAMDSLIVASGISTLAAVGTENFISMAITLGFLVGIFQFLFGLFRLGFIVNFMSRPVISGFTTGSAIIIGANQIGNLLGADISRSNHIQSLIGDVLREFENINILTLIVGIVSVLIIAFAKKYIKKIPASLIVVILGILVSFFFNLENKGTEIIGKIPGGLPEFHLPVFDKSVIYELVTLAITLAFIGFLEAISIGKSIEVKHNNYQVNSNQELIALGMGNMIGSLFQSYPATAGFARTAVNDQSGAKTPLSSFFAALIILLTLLFLTPLFYYLPKTVLASIIIVAAYGLFDFQMPKKLLRFNYRDLIILNVTLLITIFLGIKEGILTGVILSLIILIYQSTKPNMAVLGRVPDTPFYRNIDRFKNVIIDKEILIVRFDAQLYFANISYFKENIKKLAKEKGDDLKIIIIDFESINALDGSAIYALEEIYTYFNDLNVRLALSGIKGPVRDDLAKSGLMKKIRYDHCFMSIQEAVDCYYKSCFKAQKRYTYQEYIKQINR
jgi:SulP family sulfate permease